MSDRRRVCYVTGTRADFGLMQSTLRRIQESPALELSVLVTGMHLQEEYGLTVRDIEASALPIAARVEIEPGEPSGALMAKNIGRMLIGFTEALTRVRPEVVLLLGDRGEMLAGALAAIHLDLTICHIHGGERSGTVDEPVRHAISKLSHNHFVATEESRDRLVRMGEQPESIRVVGAPGLDGLRELADADRAALCGRMGFDPGLPVALLVYHPVLQEAERAGRDTELVIRTLRRKGLQVLAFKPNSDAGSVAVQAALESAAKSGHVRLVTHLPRAEYVSWLAVADVMVGNSSSGVIEAATFGTPVVNIGSRQMLRQRNHNVVDAAADEAQIEDALARAFLMPRVANNVYGDGRAGERIVRLLETIDLGGERSGKVNAY